MKRNAMLVLVFLLALVSRAVAADADSGAPAAASPAFDIDTLIRSGVFGNEDRIRDAAATLSEAERQQVYDEYRKPAFRYSLLNLVPGFGLGSFIQRDGFGGRICLAGDIVGIGGIGVGYVGMIVTGFSIMIDALFASASEEAEEDLEDASGAFTAFMIVFYCGIAIFGSSKVFGAIRPIYYASKYNSALKSSLSGGAVSSIGVVPVAIERRSGIAIRIGL